MSPSLLRGMRAAAVAVCAAVACAPAAAAATAPTTKVVATASFAGETAVQSVTYDLREMLRSVSGRVESRPSADTMVVAWPVVGLRVLGPGRAVERRMKPCMRTRIQASLYPGVWDPRTLARQLVPVADEMRYVAISHSVLPIGAKLPPYVFVWRSRATGVERRGAQGEETQVVDWRHHWRYGFAAVTTHTTILRVDGDCAYYELDGSDAGPDLSDLKARAGGP